MKPSKEKGIESNQIDVRLVAYPLNPQLNLMTVHYETADDIIEYFEGLILCKAMERELSDFEKKTHPTY